MKALGPSREVRTPLNAATLDLRTPAGKLDEGYFRLIINAISDREGRMRRVGGWRPLTLYGAAPTVNEDLHDQLLTNHVSPTLVGTQVYVGVIPPEVYATASGEVFSPVAGPTITYLAADITVDNVVPGVSISVVPSAPYAYATYQTYRWRFSIRTTAVINHTDPGHIDLFASSLTAGGQIRVRFSTDGDMSSGSNQFAYGCAPADSYGFSQAGTAVPGDVYQVTPWSASDSDSAIIQPFNTGISC